jgi:hypothetical protein
MTEWNSPPSLLESVCVCILKNLPHFCEVRFGILYLKREVRLPIGTSDVLLETYTRMRQQVDLSPFNDMKRVAEAEDDAFVSIFFNPEGLQTRLKRARLEDLKLTADVVISLIRYHPDLEELNVNVSDTNGALAEAISSFGGRLSKLNFYNFQTLFGDEMQRCFRTDDPEIGAPYKKRQFILNTPNVLSLGVKRKTTHTAGMFSTLLKPMTRLQHLDLSNSVVDNFTFLFGTLQKSLVSLCLHAVKITNADFPIIASLKRLR